MRLFGLAAIVLLTLFPSPISGGAMEQVDSRTLLGKYIDARAAHYRLDPKVVRGVIQVESRFSVEARGRAGEVGLMQIKLSTARWLMGNSRMTRQELANPFVNVEVGMRYLAQLRAQSRGSIHRALLCYNRGIGTVTRYERLKLNADNGYPGKVLQSAGLQTGPLLLAVNV